MGRPYRAIMSRMPRRMRTEGLHVDRARDILDALFLTIATGSRSRNLNEDGDDGCRVMVEDLRDVGKKINSKNPVRECPPGINTGIVVLEPGVRWVIKGVKVDASHERGGICR